MSRYSTNAVYEKLKSESLVENYFFVEDCNWMLLYGNKSDLLGKVLLYVSEIKGDNFDITEREKKVIEVLNSVLGIKACILKYKEGNFSNTITLYDHLSDSPTRLQPHDLLQFFKKCELKINSQTCKAINDSSSSPFHDWQRDNLGNEIVVTDIDLLELSAGNIFVHELKRSYYSLEKWSPFPMDFINFKLLINSFGKDNFKIIYNVRTTKPFIDDISAFTTFSVKSYDGKTLLFEKTGPFQFEDIFRNK